MKNKQIFKIVLLSIVLAVVLILPTSTGLIISGSAKVLPLQLAY